MSPHKASRHCERGFVPPPSNGWRDRAILADAIFAHRTQSINLFASLASLTPTNSTALRYARSEAGNRIVIRPVSDNANVAELPTETRLDNGRAGLRFSPDGLRIAVLETPENNYRQFQIRDWDIATKKILFQTPSLGGINRYSNHFDFSPDSQTLASCDKDGSIQLHDFESGNLVARFGSGPMP